MSSTNAPSADDFPATAHAAWQRLQAIQPSAYARSRNHLEGAVTRLSPYITHGVLSLGQVARQLQEQHGLTDEHKLMYELGWRAYFQHVWHHEGPGILRSLHPGPLPDSAYQADVPVDVREARTGLAAIDEAVSTLYRTGYLHNHARLWLASYLVHLRKVHWRAGADWLYGHLLDGDLASNHLSWQWVAGTGSHKPYLFNADNVARFAPRHWQVNGTLLDTDHDTLLDWAHQADPAPGAAPGPGPSRSRPSERHAGHEPTLWHQPPFTLRSAQAADLEHAWLVHPWALQAPPPSDIDGEPPRRRVGVFIAAFHRRWGWSAQRWHFVHGLMQPLCDEIVWLDTLPPASSRCVDNPHLHIAQGGWPPAALRPAPAWRADPGRRCRSFSQYWRAVSNTAAPSRAHQ
jgi:deoxyribodipyrimidine photo-lyase